MIFPAAVAALAITFLMGHAAVAEQPSPTEARLREALRNTVLQLRTAQGDNAALQGAKAELEAKNKELDDKVKLLTKNSAEDRDAAKKSIDSLNAKVEEQARALDALKKALEESQSQFHAADTESKAQQVARKALEEQVIGFRRVVADQKAKNAELYKLGRDILLRYEKFGLGEALGAKEPFIGTTRVKIESFAQDFQDKLDDQKIQPAAR